LLLRHYIAALLVLTACRAGPPAQQTISRDSAGINLVENRGADRDVHWTLEPVATISGGTGSNVELSQLTEYTVDTDTLGHIYVNDSWYGQRVQLLDTAGHFLRALTRKGAGPGEVGEGVSISVSGDGVLAVTDFTKTGIVRVQSDGTVLPVLLLTGYDLFGGARVSADTVVVHTLDSHSKGGVEQLQYRTDHDTATLAVHTPQRLGWLPFCKDGMEGLTPMLAPDLRWTARGSEVLVHHSGDYRIDEFHGSHFARTIRRDVAGVPGDVVSVRRFFPEGKIIGSRECVVSAAELVAKRGVASTIQPIRRLAIDLEGRIWAERNTFPDETPRTDVFDKSGRYLGTLAGYGAPLGFPSRDLLVFALPDSTSDTPRLGIFRRKP
jgi:hypothetical protein